jgi:hypothetical protein
VSPRLLKIVGGIALALVLAVAVGWLWGAQGRWEAERRLTRLQLDHEYAEARAGLRAAQVELYRLNFGEAASSLEAAKQSIQRALTAAERDDQAETANALRTALAAADEARRLAAAVNQSAQGSAERALTEVQRARSLVSR